ncbi:MAG: aminotransferase class V-fold PLP-dependent enzyme [Hyphomicrobiales bacterium]
MRSEVSSAMTDASRHCVDIAELQAAASRIIANITGAEAGYVASGASACLLLATAACITGLNPSRMARLPDTKGLKNEVIMIRSQRNFYDHAVRSAGISIIEVGLPDRYSGAGVRDAEDWEIEAAITERTAAIFYIADAHARPPLTDITRLAKVHGIPVIVDAAAQLPPQSNLRRFIDEGADLVAFSGGKVIGGPQASGILCGKQDLIMAAALQHLDFDIFWDMWKPPETLIDKSRMIGVPQHGIGRPCKVGKEEIVGLLTALQLFVEEGDDVRHARWKSYMNVVADGLSDINDIEITRLGYESSSNVPTLDIKLHYSPANAAMLINALQSRTIPVHVDPMYRNENRIGINPICLNPEHLPIVIQSLRDAIYTQRA